MSWRASTCPARPPSPSERAPFGPSAASGATLVRIDPATNTAVARVHLEPYVCCVAVASDYVWAMNRKIWKLSPDGEILGSQAIEGDGANLSVAPDALWVAEGISGKVTRVDPQTDAVRSLHVGGLALIADVRGGVAAVVTDVLPASVADAVDGPVLHVAMNNDQLQPLDLAIGDPAIPISRRSQLAEATCASLGDGAPPTWSADGRTATFRVTAGLRFSPPSNRARDGTDLRRHARALARARAGARSRRPGSAPGRRRAGRLPRRPKRARCRDQGPRRHHRDHPAAAGRRPPRSARRGGVLRRARGDAGRAQRHRGRADPRRRPVLPRDPSRRRRGRAARQPELPASDAGGVRRHRIHHGDSDGAGRSADRAR